MLAVPGAAGAGRNCPAGPRLAAWRAVFCRRRKAASTGSVTSATRMSRPSATSMVFSHDGIPAAAGLPGPAGLAGRLRPVPAAPDKTSIVLADHDRLVVTCNKTDETVYVLRPPGEDPRAILRVARLVLPEGRYWELARQLGVPAVEPVE